MIVQKGSQNIVYIIFKYTGTLSELQSSLAYQQVNILYLDLTGVLRYLQKIKKRDGKTFDLDCQGISSLAKLTKSSCCFKRYLKASLLDTSQT